ncbi:MAG: PP2C family protein-serine/threonine phosphatase [Planctomycetota bacterium]|jgi:sigma-B regulation protein RsbU (phosphoserine phosphatase)
MLPDQPPQVARLDFGCVYDPTLQVGGDFYDFIELSNGELGVCIADVVGKGLPAALLMASVRSALRASAKGGLTLEEILAEVNRHMYRDTLVGEFTTVFYGKFSSDGRAFTYCNAGHPAPVVLRGDDFIELVTGGLVIGVQPGAEYEHETMVLQPEDVLVMMTDGVTEAISFDGDAYGRERLLASICRHRSLDAQQLAQQILWDVRRFVGLAHQSDDITIVVAKVS